MAVQNHGGRGDRLRVRPEAGREHVHRMNAGDDRLAADLFRDPGEQQLRAVTKLPVQHHAVRIKKIDGGDQSGGETACQIIQNRQRLRLAAAGAVHDRFIPVESEPPLQGGEGGVLFQTAGIAAGAGEAVRIDAGVAQFPRVSPAQPRNTRPSRIRQEPMPWEIRTKSGLR